MRPLVDPGPPLTAEQADRWARHLLLPQLGEDGQRRLLAARVAVVGAGGLGSPALLYLAAAGVGRLTVIDDDVVESSNLQRQVLHGVADVGAPKIDSAAARLAALAPDVEITRVAARLDATNAADLLTGHDLVLDGTDTFETRYAVADACAALGLPLIWGSVLAFDAQVSVFWSAPPDGVPAVGLRDLFPTPPAPGTVPSCAEAGVLGSLTGQVGSVMATEAIKLITGVGDPLLGRVLVLDGLAQRWHEVPLRPAPPTASPTTPSIASHPQETAVTDQSDQIPMIDVETARRRATTEDVTFLDVREPDEVAAGAIDGALHVPLAQLLTAGGRAVVPRDGLVVAYCKVGPRSERAVAALREDGIDAVSLLGGYPAWASSS